MYMKTKILLLLTLFTFQQIVFAQGLKKEIKKSVIEIGESFTNIPKDRLLILDQVAYKLIKRQRGNDEVDVVIIDSNNSEKSQLAMIWLKTGLHYYGFAEFFNINSAGTNYQSNQKLSINSLKLYGFNLIKKSNNHIMVDYGSGSWEVFVKPIEKLNLNNATEKVFVENGILKGELTQGIELIIMDSESIPREMLYISTRINNLLSKQK